MLCRRLVLFFLISTAGLVFPTFVAAQGNQAAGIIGQVKDSTDAILPGVTVTATSPALQLPQVSTVTDAQGEFRLSPLPVGVYTVAFELSGFQSVRREGIRLDVGFTARVDQKLSLGAVAESVTVSGATPLVDVTSSTVSTQRTNEELQALPTSRDGLKSFLGQVPGVTTNLEVGSSSLTDTVVFKAYGQRGFTWQTLDGILFGAADGEGALGSHLDFGSIDASRVETVGTNAENPRRGMLVDTVLKSGGNQFHGDAMFYGSSHQLESNNLDDGLRAQGVQAVAKLHGLFDVSGSLGGRIVRDKLWFFGSARHDGFTRDTGTAFYPDGTPVTNVTGMPYYVGKLSYQMTPSQRFSGFYHRTSEQALRGATQFVAIESQLNVDFQAGIGGANYQATLGKGALLDVEVGQFRHYGIYTGIAPDKVATMDIATQMVTGANTRDGERWLNLRRHAKGTFSLYKPDLLHGDHNFKMGVDYLFSRESRGQLSRSSGNYQLVFNNGVPFQLNTYNYPDTPLNDGQYLGGYIQDNWTVARRVTIAAGVRFAHDNAYAPEQCSPAVDFAPAACYAKVQLKIWDSVAPRLHASWDISGDGHTVLKGGYGRFVQLRNLNPDVVATNRANGTTTTWNWHDLNGNRAYDPGEVNLDPNGPDFRSISGVTNAVPNPDELAPKEDEWVVSLERQFAGEWAVRGSGIYTRNFNVRRLAETSRPYSAYNIPITNPDPGPDGVLRTADDPGRTITYYDYAPALSSIAFAGTMAVNDPNADTTYKTLELVLTRRLTKGWQVQASFTTTLADAPFGVDLQPLNPNSEINTGLHNWEREVKISGSYVLPFQVLFSANYDYNRGLPQARQVLFTGGQVIRSIVLNVEPLGSLRLPGTHLVDLRFGKRMKLNGTGTLELKADIFNVLNGNPVTARNLRSGSTYLVPSTVLLPRIIQLGATFGF